MAARTDSANTTEIYAEREKVRERAVALMTTPVRVNILSGAVMPRVGRRNAICKIRMPSRIAAHSFTGPRNKDGKRPLSAVTSSKPIWRAYDIQPYVVTMETAESWTATNPQQRKTTLLTKVRRLAVRIAAYPRMPVREAWIRETVRVSAPGEILTT
jgi:hypothetical protein